MSSNATTTRQHRLLEEVQQRIKVLESAVSRIISTQKGLQINASEVRAVIQRDISRQLELLRSREVWLLNRVDLVQHSKRDALCQQQEQLNCALGSLRNWLAVNACADEMLTAKITATLDVLAELEMSPSQSASVSFTADVDRLRSAIRAFGTVDVTDMMTNPTSASLPPAVDEYDDMPHHVLYKTVEDVKAKKWNDRSIQVAFPKLTSATDSSLLSTDVTADRKEVQLSSDCAKPVGSFSPESKCVKQWLQDIQLDMDIECDDDDDSGFELISRHAGQAISTSTGHSETRPQMTYFQDIAKSPCSEWLTKAEARLASNDDCSYQVMRYFRTVSKDIKDWLLNRQPPQEQVKDRSVKQEDNGAGGVTDRLQSATWLSTTGCSQRLDGWLSGAMELPASELRHNLISRVADVSHCPSAWLSTGRMTGDAQNMWLVNGGHSLPAAANPWLLTTPRGDGFSTLEGSNVWCDGVGSHGGTVQRQGMDEEEDCGWDKESGERTEKTGRCDSDDGPQPASAAPVLFGCFAKKEFNISHWLLQD